MTTRTAKLLIFLLASIYAGAQSDSANDPYLLRLVHETLESQGCVLLQKNGAFHAESNRGDSTRVLEGSLNPHELQQVESYLNDDVLAALSSKQIEEPLIHHGELLHIDIARTGHWQELTFLSAESQQPFRRSLQPLLQWMNNLHKVPHKELSEDEGKNNCLVPRKIELKMRGNDTPIDSSGIASNRNPTPPQSSGAAPSARPAPVQALLRVFSFRVKSSTVEQQCTLVTQDGSYRTEKRAQKQGSRQVRTKIDGGRVTPQEMSELQQLLADPALAKIHHHETSRLVLPMMGEMLHLQIARASGVQEVILSSSFASHSVPFFYSGDGDIASARPLLRFLAEHVENNQLGGLDPSLRNDCQNAP